MSTVLLGIYNKEIKIQLRNFLNKQGLAQVHEAKDTDSLLRLARKVYPQLIILDAGSYGPNGLTVAKIIAREKIAPVIFIISQSIYLPTIEELINKEAYAATYLVTPFNHEQLRIAITTTLATFKKINDLEQKVIKLNESLAERKKISQAKELLMKQNSWTEPQAHRYLQKQSMNTGKPVKFIAQKILNEF